MAFLTQKSGRIQDANAIRTQVLEGCEVGLTISAITPGDDDVLADYEAEEASWTGYARQTPASWSAAVIDVDDHAVLYAALLSFTVTSGGTGETVFDYFVVVDGELHHSEELDDPIDVVDGVPVSILIQYWVQTP